MNNYFTSALNHTASHRLLVLSSLLLAAVACSSIPPADTGGPRSNQPAYPIKYNEDPQRREATLIAIKQVMTGADLANTVTLHPITGTIQRLPVPTQSLYLPKLGLKPVMTQEETREALRRFIVDWRNIIGADPAHLSLITWVDQPDGVKIAVYEQRPFRYPLRGDFGKLEIRFTADRRVLNVNSTCLPDAERLQSTLASVTAVVKPEDAVKFIQDKGVSYSDPSGTVQTIHPGQDVFPRELVFYVIPSPSPADSLEFHLAWELELTNAPVKRVYLDAVNAQVLGTA